MLCGLVSRVVGGQGRPAEEERDGELTSSLVIHHSSRQLALPPAATSSSHMLASTRLRHHIDHPHLPTTLKHPLLSLNGSQRLRPSRRRPPLPRPPQPGPPCQKATNGSTLSRRPPSHRRTTSPRHQKRSVCRFLPGALPSRRSSPRRSRWARRRGGRWRSWPSSARSRWWPSSGRGDRGTVISR